MINRKDLVSRHNPVLQADRPADPAAVSALTASPLSVGNGEFAFTADFTGLQTLRDAYRLGPPVHDVTVGMAWLSGGYGGKRLAAEAV